MDFQINRAKFTTFAVVLTALVMVSYALFRSSFYGNAVKSEAVILLSSNELESVGYDALVDSLILPTLSRKIAFNLYANHLDLSKTIKNGRYRISEGMGVVEIVRMLKLGEQEAMNVVFHNVRSINQLAGKLAMQIEADSTALVEAFVLEQERSGDDMLTIIIPNTYQFYWTVTPEDYVARMRRESERFWNEDREQKRKALKMSRGDVISLAAIVDEETNQTSEMARIAGAYINRLKRGMKLQSDPTVKYAVGDFTLRRILKEHLKVDSPYNTYLYKGLTPTPIYMPCIAAIDGVLNYEKHNYIFFCARPTGDGFHDFAATYSQHLANARAYHAELNRRNVK